MMNIISSSILTGTILTPILMMTIPLMNYVLNKYPVIVSKPVNTLPSDYPEDTCRFRQPLQGSHYPKGRQGSERHQCDEGSY